MIRLPLLVIGCLFKAQSLYSQNPVPPPFVTCTDGNVTRVRNFILYLSSLFEWICCWNYRMKQQSENSLFWVFCPKLIIDIGSNCIVTSQKKLNINLVSHQWKSVAQHFFIPFSSLLLVALQNITINFHLHKNRLFFSYSRFSCMVSVSAKVSQIWENERFYDSFSVYKYSIESELNGYSEFHVLNRD